MAGLKIRALREAQKLSQEQLAAKLQLLGAEITQRTVSRIETGLRVVPDYELLFYAKALHTDILTLLQEPEES